MWPESQCNDHIHSHMTRNQLDVKNGFQLAILSMYLFLVFLYLKQIVNMCRLKLLYKLIWCRMVVHLGKFFWQITYFFFFFFLFTFGLKFKSLLYSSIFSFDIQKPNQVDYWLNGCNWSDIGW